MPGREPSLAQLLRVTTREIERRMMSAVALGGLEVLRPRHLTLLRVLDPSPAGVRMSALAHDADVSRQAIQQVALELERLGIVEIAADPLDARARLVRYTDYGREGFLRCMAQFELIEVEYADLLGPRRLRELKRALARLPGAEPHVRAERALPGSRKSPADA